MTRVETVLRYIVFIINICVFGLFNTRKGSFVFDSFYATCLGMIFVPHFNMGCRGLSFRGFWRLTLVFGLKRLIVQGWLESERFCGKHEDLGG